MADSTVLDRPLLRRLVARRRREADARAWSNEALAITLIVAILTLVGLIMTFSASFVDSAVESGDPFDVFRRQAAWALVGVPVFWLAARSDHRSWRRLSWLLMAASLASLVLVLLPGVGLTRSGSTRWLGFGPLVFQPTELAKLATLLWLADVLHRKRELQGGGQLPLRHLLVPAVPLLVVEATLIMLQPDLGTTIVVALIVGLVLFVEGLPMRFVVTGLGVGAATVGGLALLAPYRLARITGWLNPDADPLGDGYQLLQSLYALGSGGWFGLGLGSSRGKWSFIPNPETDFIFAIIGEELGLVGALAVLALFAALLVTGLRAARQARDPFAHTIAFAITGWLIGQAIINICTVTGLLPITGMTLPLVSVGGTSLVATLFALGLLVSIARTGGERAPARDDAGPGHGRTDARPPGGGP